MLKTHPGQTDLRLLRRGLIFGNDQKSLCGRDQDCRPAGEGSHETKLHRSANMGRGKWLCWSGVQYKDIALLFLYNLRGCELLKF
jgi:hypothetical protein